MFVSEVTWKLC